MFFLQTQVSKRVVPLSCMKKVEIDVKVCICAMGNISINSFENIQILTLTACLSDFSFVVFCRNFILVNIFK